MEMNFYALLHDTDNSIVLKINEQRVIKIFVFKGSGMPFCKSELEAWYPEQSESLSEVEYI